MHTYRIRLATKHTAAFAQRTYTHTHTPQNQRHTKCQNTQGWTGGLVDLWTCGPRPADYIMPLPHIPSIVVILDERNKRKCSDQTEKTAHKYVIMEGG